VSITLEFQSNKEDKQVWQIYEIDDVLLKQYKSLLILFDDDENKDLRKYIKGNKREIITQLYQGIVWGKDKKSFTFDLTRVDLLGNEEISSDTSPYSDND